MPRIARSAAGGLAYHVINRGNGRRTVFHKDIDYEAFLKAMAHACVEVPMPVLGYCLLPNHFHLVLFPKADGDLSRWMHWVLNAHVRRYHKQHESSGHVWQGRYKSFPIEADEHLLTVLRYVERNPVRAGLVKKAEQWAWSSAPAWLAPAAERPSFLAEGPIVRPDDWLKWVNKAVTSAELGALRQSVNRGSPYGSPGWTASTAKQLGLESTMRPRGRPRKTPLPTTA
jgi:putative transposase